MAHYWKDNFFVMIMQLLFALVPIPGLSEFEPSFKFNGLV